MRKILNCKMFISLCLFLSLSIYIYNKYQTLNISIFQKFNNSNVHLCVVSYKKKTIYNFKQKTTKYYVFKCSTFNVFMFFYCVFPQNFKNSTDTKTHIFKFNFLHALLFNCIVCVVFVAQTNNKKKKQQIQQIKMSHVQKKCVIVCLFMCCFLYVHNYISSNVYVLFQTFRCSKFQTVECSRFQLFKCSIFQNFSCSHFFVNGMYFVFQLKTKQMFRTSKCSRVCLKI